MGGIKLLENKTKYPFLSIGESKSLTEPWKNPTWKRKFLALAHLYQHMNRNHMAVLCKTYCTQLPVFQKHTCRMWLLNKMLFNNAGTGHQTAGFLLNVPKTSMLEHK